MNYDNNPLVQQNRRLEPNVFRTLNNVDVSNKIKEKLGLSYLSWSSAWAEVKKKYPDATYEVKPQILDEMGNTRFWHDDGKSGWVEVSVTIGGIVHTEVLAIMDLKSQPISAENITSVHANKSMKRCLVKACAMHGLGMYIYEGEELPEDTAQLLDLQEKLTEIAKKKSSLSEKAKETTIEICRNAEKEANPNLEEEFISGKISNINDMAILENLKKKLLAIRK